MSKYTFSEREQVKTLVAALTIKRIPDADILDEIRKQTGKSMNKKSLWSIRQLIKKESYHWYKTLRQGEYEFLHEFRERINEIMDLQRRHYKIVEDNANNPSIVQASLVELHKLSTTLSNLYDVAPYIIPNLGSNNNNDNSLPNSPEDKKIIV